MHNLLE